MKDFKTTKRKIKTKDGKEVEVTILYKHKKDVDKIAKLWSKKTRKDIKNMFNS